MEIQKEYGDEPPVDVMKENMDLFHMGLKITWIRTMDLFQTIIDSLFLNEEPLNKLIFWGRFHAFFNTPLKIVKMLKIEDDFYKQFEREYGEDWPDVLQKKYGDDWPEPDYSEVGEKDFNTELGNLFKQKKIGLIDPK